MRTGLALIWLRATAVMPDGGAGFVKGATPVWVRPAGNVTSALTWRAQISTRSAAVHRIELQSPGARGFLTKKFFPERPLDHSSGLFDSAICSRLKQKYSQHRAIDAQAAPQ